MVARLARRVVMTVVVVRELMMVMVMIMGVSVSLLMGMIMRVAVIMFMVMNMMGMIVALESAMSYVESLPPKRMPEARRASCARA